MVLAIFCVGFKCRHDKCLAIVQKNSQQKCSYALFYQRSCDDNAGFLGTWKTTSALVSLRYPGKPSQRQGRAQNYKKRIKIQTLQSMQTLICLFMSKMQRDFASCRLLITSPRELRNCLLKKNY